MNERLQIQKMPAASSAHTRTSFSQHKCACGGSAGLTGECMECHSERLTTRPQDVDQRVSTSTASAVHETLQPSGRRLKLATQSLGESRLGHNFRHMSVYGPKRWFTPVAQSTTSLEETDQGTETVEAEPRGTATADGGGAPTAGVQCGVTGSWVDIPNGVTLPATLNGNKLGADFKMVGDFTHTAIPCSCSCGEYRQYVRGEFKKNGAIVTHPLCGTNLDPKTFQEDCARRGGTDYKYGYRSIPFATSKFTNPDQATGCRFEGYDYPGIRGTSGDTLEVNLDFSASLVDTCNNATLAGADWSVTGSATVP